jgi:hypothetical protein
MTAKTDSITNEHVLEIRYKPNPRVLDHRGTWAEQISEHLSLAHWRIVENRVDVFSEGQIEHAFVGFRNAGFTASDTPTRNFFSDKATKLFRFLFTLDAFGDSLHVERLGVRSRFCTPFDGSFEDLTAKFSTRYLTIAPAALKAIGDSAKLIDIGAPLNFVDKLGNFNSNGGPMTEAQLTTFFRKDAGFPDVGLFYDIDYFIRPGKVLSSKEVLGTITGFATEAWERHERVKALVLGA